MRAWMTSAAKHPVVSPREHVDGRWRPYVIMRAPHREDATGPPASDRSARGQIVRPEILLVDDDPMLLEMLTDLIHLRLPQANVVTCLSGAAALGVTAASDFHAIVTDLKMPHMDGLTLLTRLKQTRPTTPILVITGHGDRTSQAQAMESGAWSFLEKPLDRDRFMQSLQGALAQGMSGDMGHA